MLRPEGQHELSCMGSLDGFQCSLKEFTDAGEHDYLLPASQCRGFTDLNDLRTIHDELFVTFATSQR